MSSSNEKKFYFLLLLLYLLGWGYLILLPYPEPLPAQKLYIDENALRSESVASKAMLPYTQTWFEMESSEIRPAAKKGPDELARLYQTKMEYLGCDTYEYVYTDSVRNQSVRISYAIMHGHRNDNRESLVLVSDYSPSSLVTTSSASGAVSGLGYLLSIASYLENEKWTSKNTIFVAVENSGAPGDSALAAKALNSWVDIYVNGAVGTSTKYRNDFGRAGNIIGTLVLNLPTPCYLSSLSLVASSKSGLLPNLDIVSLVNSKLKDQRINVLIAETESQPELLRHSNPVLAELGMQHYKGLFRFALDSMVSLSSCLL